MIVSAASLARSLYVNEGHPSHPIDKPQMATVDLQALAPDGSTWLALPTAVHFTANGTAGPTYLPPGKYRFAIATATAVYASVAGIPLS